MTSNPLVNWNISLQYESSFFNVKDILHTRQYRHTSITLNAYQLKAFLYSNCFLQCLQHKAFHPNEPLPPIEQHLLEMLEIPHVVKERCQAPLEKVKALFPLKEVSKKKEEKTAQDIFKDK